MPSSGSPRSHYITPEGFEKLKNELDAPVLRLAYAIRRRNKRISLAAGKCRNR